MPIRINLLEEEQKQKLARKHDPLMLAVRLGVLAVVSVLVYSLILYTKQKSLREQLTALKNEWAGREPKVMKVENEIKILTRTSAKTDLLHVQAKNRFLWAPQLELFKDVVPGSIQLTRFAGRREITTPPPIAGSKGPPPGPAEIVKVTLEGIAEGGRPELVVHDFLNKLKANERLAQYVDDIKLVSMSKGSIGPANPESNFDVTSARFVIEILYKQRPVTRA